MSMLLRITTLPSQRRTVTGFKQCEITRLLITWKNYVAHSFLDTMAKVKKAFFTSHAAWAQVCKKIFEPQSDSMSDFCQLSSLSLPQFQVI